MTEILLQRRLELAFEGDRFFTLQRLGLGVSRNGAYGDAADGTGELYKNLTLPAGDIRFEFPIPQSEMNANSNMVQNPGY
ncbi:MAG: RagB/SusD family nutrient uptake outer membrane protein [Bacteroidales bacterium]|nr:RagB/SusD family nutrient uptake outer membrane protein [Bacteroidales bacterium]